MNKSGFFTDENGVKSSRRLNAFLLVLDSIINTSGSLAAIIVILIKSNINFSWPLAAAITAAGLVPLAGGLAFAFFTTWGDVANVARAIKKGE